MYLAFDRRCGELSTVAVDLSGDFVTGNSSATAAIRSRIVDVDHLAFRALDHDPIIDAIGTIENDVNYPAPSPGR